jgi:transcriptional regulator with XRE-family HTH domain
MTRHETFVNNLRFIRYNQGLSAQDIENVTDGEVSRHVIANLESGRRTEVSVTLLEALAGALQVTVAELWPSLGSGADQYAAGYRRAWGEIRELAVDKEAELDD